MSYVLETYANYQNISYFIYVVPTSSYLKA